MKITNLISGERVKCSVEKATRKDVLSCAKNFKFDWLQELKYELFKLVTEENPGIVQALISIEIAETHLVLSKIERAGFGTAGIKIYEPVAKLLVAFACKFSFDLGFDGYVTFISKTKLIDFYHRELGANR